MPETIITKFETTRWTEVVGATSDPAQLERLLGRYWRPIYAYLRRAGRRREDAADLTQSFVAEVVLGRRLIERADPDRGRFRSLLLTALQRFLIDEHRKASSERRSPTRPAVALGDLDGAEPSAPTPEAAFDEGWAASLVQLTIERVEADCLALGLEAHWRAFEMRVLGPTVRQGHAPTIEQIGVAVGVADGETVSKMIYTVKRRFRATFEQAVRETLADDGALDEEIASLRALLPVV